MVLFNKLLKKEIPSLNNGEIAAPVSGQLIYASDLADVTFREELLGQTIGIIPEDKTIVCPVNGTVVSAFPTGHAFGIQTEDGVSYLVHIGVDTVMLNGKPFKMHLKEGQQVFAGQKAVTVDWNMVEASGCDKTVMLIVAEKTSEDFRVDYIEPGKVISGQKISRN